MRKLLIIFIISLGGYWSWAGKPVHVIITAGQSNTDGRVKNLYLPDYIKSLATDTISFSQGAYPYCQIAQNRTDGYFIPFWPHSTRKVDTNQWAYDAVAYYWLGKTWQQKFYVIKWAVGGTAISPRPNPNGQYWSADASWLAQNTATSVGGRSLLLSLIQNIDACIDSTLSKIPQGYQIDAFLWHQGESDKGRGKSYDKNLKTLVAYVRQHLSEKTGKDYSQLPFIFGTVSRFNKSYDKEVEESMRRYSNEDKHAYLIDMTSGELQKDRLHFTEKPAEYLGKEMYSIIVGKKKAENQIKKISNKSKERDKR